MPGWRAGPSCRVVSPSGGSILMTSAPRSPSCCAAHGPSTTVVQSRIRTPASGPAIWSSSVPSAFGHLRRQPGVSETWRHAGAKFPATASIAAHLRGVGRRYSTQPKEVAMRSIWMSRLSRTSTIAAIAGLAIVAGGAAAEARWDGYYYDGWGYRQYYSRP